LINFENDFEDFGAAKSDLPLEPIQRLATGRVSK